MLDSDNTYTVTIEGTLSWDLVYDYNSLGNTMTIHNERTITTTASIDYAAFKQTFNKAARKELEKKHAASQFEGASYEAIALDEPLLRAFISSEIPETLHQTTSSTFNSNYNKTTSHASHKATIGPDFKRATLWQQRFTSPGISVLGSAVSTSPSVPEVVTIRYLIRPIRFVRGIEVHYGDKPSDAPPNRILEYSGKNNSVNAEHGGKYVWLVPIYTYNASQAATRFDLFIQEQYHGGWDDILQGAGGNYCYLQVVEDANSLSKITEIKLYRSDVPVTGLPHPYTSRTTSINEGRSGSYLYLMWSTTTAF